ncbi:MAG: transglycosylase domain-containing protein, partial [Deltaproteobacteria bacterium]
MKKLFGKLKKISPKRLLLGAALILVLIIFSAAITYSFIKQSIDERFEQLFSTKTSQFVASLPPFHLKQKFTKDQLETLLAYSGYQFKKDSDELLMNEYSWLSSGNETQLILLRDVSPYPGKLLPQSKAIFRFDAEGAFLVIREIWEETTQGNVETFELAPRRISSYVAGRLRTQIPVALSDIPVNMRHAVMAIEDIHFLTHGGVSLRSTLRALYRDLRARRFVEGGSTITQQLMKNLFFSREKAVSRKVKEAIYAFVTESTHSKEAILEAYLNEVYLGQWSTHEIHGVSEAARFYFNRSIFDLTLSQSATLAAIIQAPNNHDPRRHPENSIKRRNLVLKKMLEADFILPDEYELAVSEPLGVVPGDHNLQDTGYFMDLIFSELPEDIKTRLDTEALTLYTALNPYLQLQASNILKDHLTRLQKDYATLAKKAKKGLQLQSAFISVDIPTGQVIALQGGSSYQKTQFNRILQGKRQPGSLFKPFVFLAAFDKADFSPPFTAITELD